MSPRKKENIVTVMAWPPLKTTTLYHGVIRSIAVDKKKRKLNATIENQDQVGRLHEISQDLPVQPGNATSLFLEACGCDAHAVGQKIDLDDEISGIHIGMRFADSNGSTIIFERLDAMSKEATIPGGQS